MKQVGAKRLSPRTDWWRRIGPALCIGGMVLVAGCSTMEDIGDATADSVATVGNAMNPFNWFDSTRDPETTEAADETRERDALADSRQSGSPAPYPKLSEVPERPREVTSSRAKRTRESLREGLIADTENAEYSDRVLRAPPQPAMAPTVPRADAARSNDRIAAPLMPAAPTPTVPQRLADGSETVPPVAAPPPPAAARADARPVRQARAAPPPSPVAPPVVAPPPPAAGGGNARPVRQARAAPSPSPVVPPAPSAPVAVPPLPVDQAAGAAPPPNRTQMAARPAEPYAPAQPRGMLKTVQVATIYFLDGSARLSANDRQVIREVANVAHRTGGRLRIIGHSSVGGPTPDPVRRQTINYKVSFDRANAVAAELLRLGVPGDRLEVGGEGDRNPIYAESSPTGAAGNRRAEIYIEYFESG